MDKDDESIIYLKASKSMECLSNCIQIFEELLHEERSSDPSMYYQARKILREGEALYQETLKNAKKFLGPTPDYATMEFEKWKKELLEKDNVLAKSEDLKDLRAELKGDELLKKWMGKREINAFLKKCLNNSDTGKRKISNVKVRIILDKLKELILRAKELQKAIMIKTAG